MKNNKYMEDIHKYVIQEVEAFKEDIIIVNGVQVLPVSDVKAHISFALISYQNDLIKWIKKQNK